MGTPKLASSSSFLLLVPYHVGIITCTYWYGLYYYTFGPGRYQSYQTYQTKKSNMILPSLSVLSALHNSASTTVSTTTTSDKSSPQQSLLLLQQQINVHLYLLSCNFYLYHRHHYRKDTYVQDLQDNLSNVAIPGTATPLSYFVYHNRIGLYCITVPFIVFMYPIVSFIAALHLYYVTTHHANARKDQNPSSIAHEYMIRLLAPNDWFTYWRYNSVLVALHAHTHHVTMESTMSLDSNNSNNETLKTTNFTIADEYAAENKWTFLQRGDHLGIPVSPYMKTPTSLVIKHKNEEGGLGIYFYNNAACASTNGEWIFQERLYNSDYVASLLPSNAPLSTFRIITCSRGATTANLTESSEKVTIDDIIPLSCVFRAGRQNAKTDHDAIFFNVDLLTGTIGGGTTNKHWYPTKNVIRNLFHTPWRTYEDDRTLVHPDGNIAVAGNIVTDISKMKHIVQNAHCTLCPHVPFCGWDIVLSTSTTTPICLLEVNLSCNFFRGTFDQQVRLIVVVTFNDRFFFV